MKKITIRTTLAAEADRLVRILSAAGYWVEIAESEDVLDLAAGDPSISLIILEGGDEDLHVPRLVKSLYEAHGDAMPPVLLICCRDPAGPIWLEQLSDRPVYWFRYGYAEKELLIIVEKLIEAYGR